MMYRDFADQYNKGANATMPGSLKVYLLSFTAFALGIGLLFFIPSKQEIQLRKQHFPPSTYQASLNEYLTILQSHSNPQNLPVSMEKDLKIVAENALILSSESKVYYPQNQKLSSLSKKVENEIGIKFPELIAQK